MTDEEREKLIADMRQVYRYIQNDEINDIIWRAADEIERLEKELEKMGRWYNATQKQLWAMKEKYGNE